MKRKLVILASVVAVIVIGLWVNSWRGKKRSIFFSQPQTQRAQSMADYRPVSFYVTNTGSRAVHLYVRAIETNSGSGWIADTRAHPTNTSSKMSYRPSANGNVGKLDSKGGVPARETVQLFFQLPPKVASPTRLRVSVAYDATIMLKARFALSRLWANVRGGGKYKQLWFDNLINVPDYEVVTPEIP